MGKNYDSEISILSGDVKFEGKLSSNGNMRIDGEFDGELTIDGNLTLGENSKSKGLIKATNVTCGGNVFGNIEAAEKLVLESSAKVEGDISAKILVVNEGAIFKGRSNLNEATIAHNENNE